MPEPTPEPIVDPADSLDPNEPDAPQTEATITTTTPQTLDPKAPASTLGFRFTKSTSSKRTSSKRTNDNYELLQYRKHLSNHGKKIPLIQIQI